MSFGSNLKQAVKKRGHDLDEVAIQLDVPASTLYGYSVDKFYPQIANLLFICKRYNIPLNELFLGLYSFDESESKAVASISKMRENLTSAKLQKFNNIQSSFLYHLEHSDLSSLGRRVRALRKQSLMSIKELAERASIGISTISNIESDTQMPSVERILMLSNTLRVSPGYLLYDYLHLQELSEINKLLPSEIKLFAATIQEIIL